EVRPDKVTLVPEKREERTTEGGLDVVGQRDAVRDVVARLRDASVPVSLFIDPEDAQVRASAEVGAAEIELHTGDYANASAAAAARELERLQAAAQSAAKHAPDLHVAAGHGLTVRNTGPLVTRVARIGELNIGHALVADAVYVGLPEAVRRFRDVIAAAERERA
ncbi:MAG: pyridoxine 5'-phosphate synthase, partial [Polyangiales bacterium]